LSLTVCVLLIALWVRSYWRIDWVSGWLTSNRFIAGVSYLGSIALEHTAAPRAKSDIYAVGWGSQIITKWDLEKEIIFPPKQW
jgi:hypothetical protein